MGLDMYLYAQKYESCLKRDEDYKNKKVNFYPKELKEIAEKQDKRNFLSKTVQYQIGYWRKANAVHRFFVEKCANGEDDCRDIYVTLDHLKELYNLVKQVLNNKDSAEELLPTQDGFFFGSTDYDEEYYKKLESTLEIVEDAIKVAEQGYEIVYHASW